MLVNDIQLEWTHIHNKWKYSITSVEINMMLCTENLRKRILSDSINVLWGCPEERILSIEKSIFSPKKNRFAWRCSSKESLVIIENCKQPKLPAIEKSLTCVGYSCMVKYHVTITMGCAQPCPTLCDPVDCSTSGSCVLHYLLKFA